MTDIPTDSGADAKGKPLSVTAALSLAASALEAFTVTLVGEVSEVSNKAGYRAVYFSVKDDQSTMPCMMWQNRFQKTGIDLRVGSLVQITGRFSIYAAKGRMNFDVVSIKLAGEGELRERVARLALELKNEGLMDEGRKRPLPVLPMTVGLVTSPRGAAVHDVLRTLRRRFPLARVVLAGVPVEGNAAAQNMIAGIECVVRGGAEVVLLVRGGGSFEDLMPFNDGDLARAVAACPVPVVTGIGHEPDTSIADMVSDRRASTPTAAAEAVSPGVGELESQFSIQADAMSSALQRRLGRSNEFLAQMASRPVLADPRQLFASDLQTLDVLADRIARGLPARIAADRDRVATSSDRLQRALPTVLERESATLQSHRRHLVGLGASLVERYSSALRVGAARLDDLSPLSILSRGYSLVRDEAGAVVTRAQVVEPGASVDLQFADGVLGCTVNDRELRPMGDNER